MILEVKNGKMVCGCGATFEIDDVEGAKRHAEEVHGRELEARVGLTEKELPKELRKLMEWARKAVESKEVREFLWKHTGSEWHYENLMEYLKAFSRLNEELCEWY